MIVIPALTSFSTLICIIMEAMNLATIISRVFAGVIAKESFPTVKKAYFHTHKIIMLWIRTTINEFWNTSDLYSSEKFIPKISSFKKTAKPIQAESPKSFHSLTLSSLML